MNDEGKGDRPDRINPRITSDDTPVSYTPEHPLNGSPIDTDRLSLPAPESREPAALEPLKPMALEPAKPAPAEPGPDRPETKPDEPEKKTKPSQPSPEKPAGGTEKLAEDAPRRKRGLWIGALILSLILLFAFYRYCGAPPTTATTGGRGGAARGGGGEQAPAAITAGQTKTGDINIYVDALGTVTPFYTVTLYSQITGRVLAVYYREGQMVKNGDPLVDIDPRPYESTLTQAEGTLERDQGLLAEAQMDLQRYQAASQRNAIPRQQLEDQEKIVQQDQGTVKADQGTVDYDKVQLSYCHIVSPITGRVGLRLVDPGNTVFSGSSSTLAVVTQLQPITIVFNVSEDELPQVQAQLRGGHTLEVDAFDRSNEKEIEAGKLTSLDNEVDTTTGTIKFRAEFPNRNLSLFPNQFVNARLLLQTLKNVVLVPTAAVQHNGTNAFVYMINQGGRVSVQQVTVLTGNDQETAVTGLKSGVDVATSGFDRLENDVAVSVTNSGTPQRNNPGHGENQSPGGRTTP